MKLTQFLIFFTLLALGLSAQNPPLQVAGLYDALSFGYGVGNVQGLKVATGNRATGSQAITLNSNFVTLQGGLKLFPIATNAPITVGSGANAETVTPSVVSCATATCLVTATFSNIHSAGEPVSSGSIGLYEAINYVNGIGGSVVVSGAWVSAGGTTAIYNAAPSIAGVLTLDNRTGLIVGGGGGGTVALNAVNQIWTGAGSLSPNSGALVLPLNVNYAFKTANTPGGRGPFTLLFNEHPYTTGGTTIIDTQMGLGYNICLSGTACVSSSHAWFTGWEDKYLVPGQDPATNVFSEHYIQFQPTANGATRPIFIQVHSDDACITAVNCNINDFELNSDPALGIGFHYWNNNAAQWASISGTGITTNGISTQSGLSLWQCTGLNSQGCEFNFTNGTVGYRGYPVTSTIWEFDMLGTANWIQYNNLKTSIGGSAAYLGNATVTIEAPSGTNPVLSLGLNTSNTANLLNLYGNTGTLLGSVSSAGALTLPNITDSALTSGNCVQAGTGGILTTTGAACGAGGSGITALTGDVTATGTGSVAATLATVNSNVGSFTAANITVNAKGLITAASNGSGGGGNTTSTSLVSGNIPVASGANSIVDSGVGAASGVLTASELHSASGQLSLQSTAGTGVGFFSAGVRKAFVNGTGNATFGSATDLAGTGSAIWGQGSVTSANEFNFATSKARMSSPVDGQLLFTNNATTGFNFLFFGAKTSSFPALHTNGATLEAYKGDSSGLTQFNASILSVSALTVSALPTCSAGTNQGLFTQVTDLVTPTTGLAITGGGGIIGMVFCDGVSWKAVTGTLGAVKATTVQTNPVFTVATLPTCNSGAEGTRAGVSDLLAPAFFTIVTGGGSVHGPVYCNGTNWIAN